MTQRIGDASYFNFFLGSRLICKHLHYNRDTVNSSNQPCQIRRRYAFHRHDVPHNYRLLIVKYVMENGRLQCIRFLIFLSFPLGSFLSIRFTYSFSWIINEANIFFQAFSKERYNVPNLDLIFLKNKLASFFSFSQFVKRSSLHEKCLETTIFTNTVIAKAPIVILFHWNVRTFNIARLVPEACVKAHLVLYLLNYAQLSRLWILCLWHSK